jgi:hypothetical protein
MARWYHLPTGRRHVFGLRVDVRDGVHVLDDGVVLFVAGKCVVLHAMEARTQVRLVAHVALRAGSTAKKKPVESS